MRSGRRLYGFMLIWLGIWLIFIQGCKKSSESTVPDYILAGAKMQGADYFLLEPDSVANEYPYDTIHNQGDGGRAYSEQRILFDLDSDGISDLDFQVWLMESPGGIMNIGSQVSPLQNTSIVFDSLTEPPPTKKYVVPNQYLDRIDSQSDFTDKTCIFDYLTVSNGEWGVGLNIWEGKTDRYLGFRKIYPDAKAVYGWMKVDILNYNDIRISEYGMTERVYLED